VQNCERECAAGAVAGENGGLVVRAQWGAGGKGRQKNFGNFGNFGNFESKIFFSFGSLQWENSPAPVGVPSGLSA